MQARGWADPFTVHERCDLSNSNADTVAARRRRACPLSLEVGPQGPREQVWGGLFQGGRGCG